MSSLRDIPPVAGKILWARQMERQLRLLSVRLSDVLGDGWENHVDGRPLKAVCDELLRNLDTQRCACFSLPLLVLLARELRTENARFWRFSAFLVVADFSAEEKAFLDSGTGLEVGYAAPYATH